MIKYFFLLFVSVSAMADHACLNSVTNMELAQEVMSRLTSSNPNPGVKPVIVNYVCENTYLYIIRTSPEGKESKDWFNAGNANSCQEQSAELSRYKSKVYDLTLGAYCEGSYLYRFQLKMDLSLTKSWNNVGTEADCRRQMTLINKQ